MIAVMRGVMLGGFRRVMRGFVIVSACEVGVVSGLLMIPRRVVFGSRAMVASGVVVMFSSFQMMIRDIF